MRPPKTWKICAALLLLLPWPLLIAGGITMCVLYAPGERIDTVGYIILAIMLLPLFASLLITAVWSMWWTELDLDCTCCGRSFYSADLATLLETRRCPGCGQAIAVEDLEDLE
jgi:hypothetical protein